MKDPPIQFRHSNKMIFKGILQNINVNCENKVYYLEATVISHFVLFPGVVAVAADLANVTLYAAERDWANAINLKVGDKFITPDRFAFITMVGRERQEEAVTVYNFHVEDWASYFVSELNIYVHNGADDHIHGGGKTPNRNTPHIEDGNLKEGWEHIDARHITGNHPNGAGDLFAKGTTCAQLEQAAKKTVSKGRRVTENPTRTMQTFEKNIVVNGKKDLVRVIVDSSDSNRVVTMFPVRGGN